LGIIAPTAYFLGWEALPLARSIPDDVIKRVQDTANIVDIIGESVVLNKAGRNYLGLCPFHAEKTPSFSVSPEKQIFYCFGCHTGGSVFSFLMQREGISFPEAVRNVAARYGIDVPAERLTPDQQRQLTEKDKLFQINELACTYFRRVLMDKQHGPKAMSYLLSRGMTRAMIEGYQLGYAAQGWDGLLNHFRERRIPEALIAKSGLAVPRKNGSGFYDRFRDRIMFPIFNLNQQIEGFGGRVMGDELPKYLNSPETPIYTKRRSLYGIHKARIPARAQGRVFLVEGYFDVLAMHLYGISNSVATLGTALTPEHAKQLKGLVGEGEVILVYDSDLAGIKAAHRSIAVFDAEALNAKILVLPQGEDPDSYLRSHGPDEFFGLVAGAMSFIPFLINSAIEEHGLSLEGKVKIVGALQDTLAAVQDNVARALYVQELAERLNIEEGAILEKIEQIRKKSAMGEGARAPRETKVVIDGRKRLELQLVAMMMRYPSVVQEIADRNYLAAFESEYLRHIAQTIVDKSFSGNDHTADLISTIENPEYRNLMAKMAMVDSQWDRHDCDRLLLQFEKRVKRQNSADLQRQIEAAENKGDFELLGELLRRKQIQAGRGLTH
jgi:DNA primase